MLVRNKNGNYSQPTRSATRAVVGAGTVALLALGSLTAPVGDLISAQASTTVGSGDCEQTVSNSTGVVVTTPKVGNRDSCQIHFTSPGSNTWTIPSGITSFRVLVVGGGGGGGRDAGGGGGGGGVYEGVLALSGPSAASRVDISVGAGGLPGVHTATGTAPFQTARSATAGQQSALSIPVRTATTFTVAAAGGAGGADGTSTDTPQGGEGGSVTVTPNALITTSQTNEQAGGRGGNGVQRDLGQVPGRGSGEPGGAGRSVTNFPANGTILGTYGGGGGGGASIENNTHVGGSGGTGGGGAGAGGQVSLLANQTVTDDGRNYVNQTSSDDSFARVFATAGIANSGGGGGSGSAYQSTGLYSINGESNYSRNGRSGGSGVVVIRYLLPLATIGTPTVSDTTTSATTVASTVESGASITARGFVYSTSIDPVIGGEGVTNVTAGSGTGDFSATLSELSAGQTYYVRAYAAIDSGGTEYGLNQVFTTAANTIGASAGSTRWFQGATVVDPDITVGGADLSGATVSINNNKPGDILACGVAGTGVTCSYNSSTGVLTLSGSATAAVYQDVLRGVTFSTTNTSTNVDDRTITFNLGGSLTYDPSTGHYYEIVTVSSAGEVYDGANHQNAQGDLAPDRISWEEARCRAKYANGKFGGALMVNNTRVENRTTQADDRCVAVAGTGTLQPRMLNGLSGHLANITSLDEHLFLKSKLSGTGWIGGSDVDLEGTWVWMDGPEAGQVFWVEGETTVKQGFNTIAGQERFNYWSNNEPNNSGGEHWAEFGFGSSGVGSSWNDCRNSCGSPNRNTYIVEYSAPAGVTPPVLSATKTITPLPAQTVEVTSGTTLVYGDGTKTLTATSSRGGAVSFAVTSGSGTVCSLDGTTLTWLGSGDCVISATAAGSNADDGYQPSPAVSQTIQMARRNLPITGISAVSREYNQGTSVTLTGTPAIDASALVAGDAGQVALAGTATGSVTAAAGANKAVTVSGLSLTGAKAAGYQPVVSGVTVTITPRPVRLSGTLEVADRAYDGSDAVTPTASSISLRAGDVLAGDTVTLNSPTFVADSPFAGTRTATPRSTLSGAAASNYVLVYDDAPSATFTITPVSLTVSSGGFTPQSRPANGTTNATITSHDMVLDGFVAGDTQNDITWIPTGVFDSATAGTNKTVTLVGGAVFGGARGGGYVLDVTGAPTALANITVPFSPPRNTRPQPPAVDPTPTSITPTGGQVLPPGRTPAPGSAPAPLAGPLPGVGGSGGQAPQAPTALIGGRLAPVNTNVVNPNQLNLQTGSSSFGVSIPQGQGSVAAQGGNTELAVQPGAQTRLSGSGLFPGSTVQVFMPLGSNGSREIAQLPVDPSGAFDGDAVFTTRPTDPPLPIGRHVLQIASLNDAGERVVVEMAINIAQSAPAPEILRANGEIPGLTPGQSLATRAGEPVDVRLTVDSTSRLTTVEGDGWAFSVDVSGDGNSVEQTADGGALISVLRGGEASISGNGFMPLTRADIWLFSDPTLLGSVDIDENGEFNGTVIVDGRVVPVGDHTLQIQGVGVDGFVLAANLGVVVSDPEAESTATTEQAAAGVLWWVVALIALLVVVALVWWAIRRRSGEAY